jgi:viologen exporter family transport system ATP-binding protein
VPNDRADDVTTPAPPTQPIHMSTASARPERVPLRPVAADERAGDRDGEQAEERAGEQADEQDGTGKHEGPQNSTRDGEPTGAAIEVAQLSKEFSPREGRIFRRKHQVTALDALTFTIEAGTAVAYLGPAGAGKTTLVELITGETTPTSGTVRTCGLVPEADRQQLVHRIGVMSGREPRLWPDLPLDESLRILADAHDLPENRFHARRAELVERLELAAFITIPVERLTPGRRIRAEIAAALVHDPELLILDEPTFELDVVAKEQVRGFLREENRGSGRTLLITTADLGDAEEICERLLVVDGGRLVHDGDLPSLIERTGTQRTLLVNLIDADQRLDDVPGTTLLSVESDGLTQRLGFVPGIVPMSRVLADVAARAGIRNLTLEEPDLTDLIGRL